MLQALTTARDGKISTADSGKLNVLSLTPRFSGVCERARMSLTVLF
jgi:hypothetical protein